MGTDFTREARRIYKELLNEQKLKQNDPSEYSLGKRSKKLKHIMADIEKLRKVAKTKKEFDIIDDLSRIANDETGFLVADYL